jgi:hypothetical protein
MLCWGKPAGVGGRFARLICISVASLAAAPAAAAACPSPVTVKSYHGTVFTGFHANHTGPDQGNGGMYAAQLKHDLTGVQVNLTHKQVIHNRKTGTHVIFVGKASGGAASVDDTYSDSGAQSSGNETHSGPLGNQLPDFGSVSLFFDLSKCTYQLVLNFGVQTTVTGTFDAGSHPTVTGTAYGDRNHIPRSLTLSNGVLLPPYGGKCPGNPVKSGQPCYKYGIGLIGLCSTSDVGTNQCPPDPVGHADFGWQLKPKT